MKILKPPSQSIIPEKYNIKNLCILIVGLFLGKGMHTFGGGHEGITTCYEYKLGSLETSLF